MKLLGALLSIACVRKLIIFSLLKRTFDKTYGVDEVGF